MSTNIAAAVSIPTANLVFEFMEVLTSLLASPISQAGRSNLTKSIILAKSAERNSGDTCRWARWPKAARPQSVLDAPKSDADELRVSREN